ncbi:TIGR03089 family protein [Pengzhenrongella phosphoraccumulans]|uniref:TIGR03089 family protein n=1 Tax=Pengzhenrongella phosphoraccumulans TaxID=3114394 RepID=UPI00388EE865
MNPPSSVAEVLALVTREPGRPRLTWYGQGGERIELSGAVLANWVSKTTNLLVEEFDAGPGVRIGLDLPAHWRTVVWALAAWRCGACVVVGDEAGAADVVVTDRPGGFPAVEQVVAVALPGLARRFDGELPAGAVDAASAVMTYGDQIGWAPEVDGDGSAIHGAGSVVRHDELVAWAGGGMNTPDGMRVLLEAGNDRDGDVVATLRSILGVLACDGSFVLLGPSVAAELAADPVRHARLVESERVNAGE